LANGVNILSAVGAYQTFANANAATQATSINTINNTLTSANVGIGLGAGAESQGTSAVAIGEGAGSLDQGLYSVAIGNDAGAQYQGDRSVAVGTGAGRTNQGDYAVAIGRNAGYTNQGNNSIIINATTGTLNQTTANTFTVAPVRNDVANVTSVMFYNTTSKEVTYGNTISIAGNVNASQFNFANGVNILSTVGAGAYGNTQVASYLLNFDGDIEFTSSTAKIGNVDVITVMDSIRSPAYQFSNGVNILSTVAGTYSNANVTSYFQSLTSLALGSGAGATTQGVGSVALGVNAGNDQGYYAVAIGIGSGRVAQSDSAVAVGGEAGWVSQGINSVAVGYRAGTTNQANSSIILNATGANLNATTANTFTVAPVRNDVSTANVAQVMFYNTTSKEITYGNTISIAGNITGNTGGFAIGYRDIPQVVFTSNATLALTDAGKHYFSSNSANVITVPNNTVVSFSIGTAISIVQQGTANLTVTPDSGVTMYLAGNSTSSSRRLGNYGMATLMKVDTDTWFINGTGVS
jgi:hypothetical protein